MKIRPFREHHILSLLDAYEEQNHPMDLFMSHYFRANKALGPKDRGVIAETIYGIIRWQGLIDYLCEKPVSWEHRLDVYLNTRLSDQQEDETIPLHTRLSFPNELFELLVKSHGERKAVELCRISNQPAPTMVRVNAMKTNRLDLLTRWQEEYDVSASRHSEWGIQFHKKINLFGLDEFKQGFFEVQDEGSQLLANLVEACPGQSIMDYCSGSGGKTLAFAPQMKNSGQIYLHDIRPYILGEAKKRLRRAGIQNAQIVLPEDPKLKKLKKKMDWVLVDAPCSGTGTMRRNPDMKWNFKIDSLQRLLGQQRVIFEKALSYMKPGGRIIFATCSILAEENEQQVEHFMKTYQLKLSQQPFQCLPTEGGMDGFYGAVLMQ